MISAPLIRPAVLSDTPAVTTLLRDLGYPVEQGHVGATLGRLLEDPGAFVFVAADDALGVVGLLSLSCRPILRLQGVAATLEELAVKSEARARGVGDRLLRYAKGLASERGWVRLEMTVTRRREVTRGDFFGSRGFSRGDCVTYRWGRLEARNPAVPTLEVPRRHELV